MKRYGDQLHTDCINDYFDLIIYIHVAIITHVNVYQNAVLRKENEELRAQVSILTTKNQALEETIRELEKQIQVLNQSVVTVQNEVGEVSDALVCMNV